MNDKRTYLDKLNTLLFGTDLRITKGDVFPDLYEYDFSSYYPEDDYIYEQKLPAENVFDIRFYGADVKNDDNAPFIQKAVDDASKSGGTVAVVGGDYVTTTVFLKSNVTLFIERDSALCSNKTGIGYNHLGIVHCDSAENVTLTGGGKIKGNGEYFGRKPLYDRNVTKHSEYIDVIEMRKTYRAQIRFAHESKYGGVLFIKNCKNFNADNFIIENSAHWSFHIENCNGVNIKNFVINNNRHVANADGFDISGSSNVDINHCFVSTADDGICLKNAVWLGNDSEMTNINITDCEVISCANSFKIGTETTYDISNVTVKDCRFYMTDLFPGTVSGIAIESADGSKVHNIKIKNIYMDRVTCPVFIRLCNRNRASTVDNESANAVEFGRKKKKASSADKDEFYQKGEVYAVDISNVNAYNAEIPVIIAGYKQNKNTFCVRDVALKDFNIEYAPYKEVYDKRAFIPEYFDVYPEAWRFRNLPAYALWARHVRGLKLLDFECSLPRSTWKEKFFTEDVK